MRLTVNGEAHTIIMTVRPAVDESPGGLTLVVFNEAQESMADDAGVAAERDPVIESLEAELLRTQERLRTMVGESTATTEELRASNEELQTINEELRSTTEELETSREELQAVNEELTTVNTELTLRMEDASKLNDDLQNLMNSAEIGTVFVDREMRLKRFTPQVATLFNVLPSDAGRPLLDITHRLEYPELPATWATCCATSSVWSAKCAPTTAAGCWPAPCPTAPATIGSRGRFSRFLTSPRAGRPRTSCA